MAELTVEVDPEAVGFDPDRLRRLDAHFARYVDEGLLPGWLVLVSRHGKIAHLSTYGERDMEAHLPVETDTLFRLASMTKPVTSVAAMMLYEQGAFELKDPVNRVIPSFAETRVFRSGSTVNMATEPTVEPVRIWHLLTRPG
ncbi:MAG TPA: serine hydrolase domain-containing protein [Acidimicrobiales bacterium]|nr:serine hydrolase domain-containing protein [Acidimicrobiales bacterium]